MSDLEDEIIKILSGHKKRLSIENIQTQLQNRRTSPKNPVPQWVISFALDSLRVRGWITKRGSLWSLRKGERAASKSASDTV
jgi:hypothetical protein